MNKIKILYIRTNQHCNARCFMCDFWKNIKTEITEEQFEKILNMQENVEMIRFTGGEPLLCKKLPKFIARCHTRGIKTSVITNGLILDSKIDELVKNGLDQIVISVDGSTAEIHDSLRGIKGLFEKIDKILEKIDKQYPSLHTRVNTVVSEKNIYNLSNLVKWLDKRNVEQWSIIPIKLDGHKWCDKISFEDFKREYNRFKETLEGCNVELMGYSADWASNMKEFWQGKSYIRPKGKCHVTRMVAFYNPFTEHLYPCNCVPHRKQSFCNREVEKEWYYTNGHKYCKGCEPLNAYCADFPKKIEENILNF